MAEALITRSDLGAWVVRWDVQTGEFTDLYDSYDRTILNWNIENNDRSRMMAIGDKVLIWVPQGSSGGEAGFWGSGHVHRESHDALPETPSERVDEDGSYYWVQQVRESGIANVVDLFIEVFDQCLAESELRAAGIGDLEIQVQPQKSALSWASAEQLARLEPLMTDPWPDPADAPEDEIIANQRRAGFGTWWQNEILETAAIDAVRDLFRREGWKVAEARANDVGWDLVCSRRKEVLRVRAKGSASDRPSLLLTANELAAAQKGGWILAVVTRAVTDPEVHVYTAPDALAKASPYLFKADL